MSFFRKLAVYVVLALWLAAAQHCGLEAAEIGFGGHADHESEDLCTTACVDGECPSIEGASHLGVNSSVRPLPPEVVLLDLFVYLVAPFPAVQRQDVMLERATPEVEAIHRVWRFVRRSALPARAPDSVA